MSYCSQNFYGKTSNVTIQNINNVKFQSNAQDVPRGNTQQTNHGKRSCIFWKQTNLPETWTKHFLQLTNLIFLVLHGMISYRDCFFGWEVLAFYIWDIKVLRAIKLKLLHFAFIKLCAFFKFDQNLRNCVPTK